MAEEAKAAGQVPEIEVFPGKDNKWFWHIKGANSEIICVSEGYVTRQKAMQTAFRLPAIVAAAKMVVQPPPPAKEE